MGMFPFRLALRMIWTYLVSSFSGLVVSFPDYIIQRNNTTVFHEEK